MNFKGRLIHGVVCILLIISVLCEKIEFGKMLEKVYYRGAGMIQYIL